MLKSVLICPLLVLVFSLNVLAAGYGQLEIQCPTRKCKIFIDDKYAASGTKVLSLKQGNHKINVFENGKILFSAVKYIGADKSLSIKVNPAKGSSEIPVVEEDDSMPESLIMDDSPPATTKVAKARSTSKAAGIRAGVKQAKALGTIKDEFTRKFYAHAAAHIEDQYCSGSIGLSLGTEFGWDRSLLYEISLSSFSGDNKKAVLSEGSISISSLDLGLIYKLDSFYLGTGTGFYTIGHTVSDSVLKAKKALNIDYDETVDSNFGFYCKGGYRFTAGGIDLDLGVKGMIVNTTANSTAINTITHEETENKVNYSLPITTISLGVIF